MEGTTNVDRKNEVEEVTTSYTEKETTYEMNIMNWDIDGKEIEPKETTTIESSKAREEKYGSITITLYNNVKEQEQEGPQIG